MEEYRDEVRLILKNAEQEMFDLNHPYVGTEHLILSLLKDKKVSFILNKYDIDYNTYLSKLISVVGKSNIKSKVILYTPLLKSVLNFSSELENNKKDVDSLTLLKSVLMSDDGVGLRILLMLNINIDEILDEIDNYNICYLCKSPILECLHC